MIILLFNSLFGRIIDRFFFFGSFFVFLRVSCSCVCMCSSNSVSAVCARVSVASSVSDTQNAYLILFASIQFSFCFTLAAFLFFFLFFFLLFSFFNMKRLSLFNCAWRSYHVCSLPLWHAILASFCCSNPSLSLHACILITVPFFPLFFRPIFDNQKKKLSRTNRWYIVSSCFEFFSVPLFFPFFLFFFFSNHARQSLAQFLYPLFLLPSFSFFLTFLSLFLSLYKCMNIYYI